jgi:hypothetical protein
MRAPHRAATKWAGNKPPFLPLRAAMGHRPNGPWIGRAAMAAAIPGMAVGAAGAAGVPRPSVPLPPNYAKD